MNSARDILTYAEQHDIRLIAENGGLVMDAPEEALTADFVKTVKKHKAEILNVISERWNPELTARVSEACVGLDMTPEQFVRVLNSEGKQQIISGELSASTLRNHAIQIDEHISDGVVNFIMEQIIR